MNLLSNAIKYTAEGSVTYRVEVLNASPLCEDSKVQIRTSVIDTGIGIRPEEKEKLFRSFVRLDAERNANIQGTGLGLNITKQLLEMMGSDLQVDSTYGRGSTFSFVHELEVTDPEPIGEWKVEEAVVPAESKYVPAFIAPKADILVIDDTVLNLKVIAGLLKETKVHLDIGTSGQECLEKIKEKHYDVILIDHMMPEMDGVETLKKIQTTHHKCTNTPVIVLTANALMGVREEYLKQGFSDYLSKPVNGPELENMLKTYIPEEKQYVVQEPVHTRAVEDDNVLAGFTLIHTEEGLANCGGDLNMYLEVLQIMVAEHDEIVQKLENAMQARDGLLYATYAHSIKSTARTIGAWQLAHLAQRLEDAGKENNWERIDTDTELMLLRYLQITQEIRNKEGVWEHKA